MDPHKKAKMNKMKDQLVEGAKKAVDEAKEITEDAREMMTEEGSALGGYKNKIVGQVKERVGHLLGNDRLEKRGHQQRVKGERVLAHHDTVGSGHKARHGEESEEKRSAAVMETLLQREAVMAELERVGGFERYRSHMKNVDLKDERDLRDLFKGEGNAFKLKQWNKQALLREIRERKTMKPLVHVETHEKGLMRSKPIKKKHFKLRKTDFLDRLWADIKHMDVQRLKKVSDDRIRDRSAPRLDLFRSVAASCEKRESLLKEIEADHRLKHVETLDKTKPEMFFDKTAILHHFEKARLLDEVRGGAELKHVQTMDKSKPTIDRDTHVKTWDRQGFLDEVRQGTDLKHI